MLRKKKCSSTKFEWQSDSLATAANNAQIEGDDVTYAALAVTTRWDNYTQISTKPFIVSRTQEVVDKAGRKSEINYQSIKRGKEIKRDAEVAILQNTTYVAGASGTARQTRGMEGWIATNCSVGATGTAPVPSTNTAPGDGTDRAISETLVKGRMQAVYEQGGNARVLLVTPSHKTSVSAFVGNATRFEEVGSAGKLYSAVDVYVTDFGPLKVVPDRFLRSSVCFLVDPDEVAFRELDSIKRHDMAKTSDGDKFLITWEYGLEVTNEAAHAQIRDLNA